MTTQKNQPEYLSADELLYNVCNELIDRDSSVITLSPIIRISKDEESPDLYYRFAIITHEKKSNKDWAISLANSTKKTQNHKCTRCIKVLEILTDPKFGRQLIEIRNNLTEGVNIRRKSCIYALPSGKVTCKKGSPLYAVLKKSNINQYITRKDGEIRYNSSLVKELAQALETTLS